MLEATVCRKSSARTQGLAPSACAGTGPRRASHAQPRRPARGAGSCSCLVAVWGAKRSPLPPCPHGPSPPHPPASAEWTLTAGTSPAATHPPAHGPRGRTGHPLSCRSPVQPGPWSGGTLTTSACPASSTLHKQILPGAPSADSSCTLPLTRGASLEAGSTALSAGGRGSCSTQSGSPKLRLGPGAGSGRLSPFRGRSGYSPPQLQTLNASNSAPYEVATKPLLLSTDHTEVCKISPQFLKQTRSFHTSGEAPLSSSGHPGDTQKRSAPRPLPVLMHGQP